MKTKEKANLEVTLKNILYYVEDEDDQKKMVEILKKYNEQLPDGRIKDKLQKFILETKKSYYDQVDYLVSDILDCSKKSDDEIKKVVSNMLNEIKGILEKAERTFWDRLCDLFKWS